MNILQRIFSVKNEYKSIFKTKVVTILGIKIKFKKLNNDKLLDVINNQSGKIKKQADKINQQADEVNKQSDKIKNQADKINQQAKSIKEIENKYNDLQKRNETQYKILHIISSPSECPKAKGELREKQIKILETMKAVKKVCNENGLTYWLDGGTFLGAVRHGGIIPWDCDADICMPREDFLKIIPLLKSYFENSDTKVREHYILRNGQANYQICLCNEGALDAWQVGGGRRAWGVDIFPIAKYYKGNITEDEQSAVHSKIKEATNILQDKFKSSREFAQNIDEVRKYIVELEKEIILENNPICSETPALYTGIDYAWEAPTYFIINWDKVFPLKTIKFEDEEFNCPNDIDYYLTNYYRKYMYFPPKFKTDADKVDDYIDSLRENKVYD